MEKSQCMTFGWILGLGMSFLLWEVGIRVSNMALQALAGIVVGMGTGYGYYIKLKKQDVS
jgi:hypothetical protein